MSISNDTNHTNSKRFEKNVEFMENLVQVYTWESCNLIRAHLTIHGRMKASEISDKVGLQGDKSVYKSLNRLIDAGLVGKELEEGSQRNAYYFSIHQKLEDPEFTPDFISYLIDKKKYHLISDYLTAANQASMGFLQVMTDLMEERISRSQNLEIGVEYLQNTMFVEAILSIDDPKPLLDKFQRLIQEELPKYLKISEDARNGIKNPAAFYLAFVPLNNAELND